MHNYTNQHCTASEVLCRMANEATQLNMTQMVKPVPVTAPMEKLLHNINCHSLLIKSDLDISVDGGLFGILNPSFQIASFIRHHTITCVEQLSTMHI